MSFTYKSYRTVLGFVAGPGLSILCPAFSTFSVSTSLFSIRDGDLSLVSFLLGFETCFFIGATGFFIGVAGFLTAGLLTGADFGGLVDFTTFFTSAIPHFGHFPGFSLRTSGCIGQTYRVVCNCCCKVLCKCTLLAEAIPYHDINRIYKITFFMVC